ncbi:MAG: Fic family protein [bacterium]|nr:Fic family protein [bacterium]
MEKENFIAAQRGHLVRATAGYWAFVPSPLPIQFSYSSEVGAMLSLADRAIGKLNGICYRLPNSQLLSGAYTRREAELSSRIEGTQSTVSDLYLFELEPETPSITADVREVSNYVRALEYGLSRKRDLPLSLRLIREIHERLMLGVRGSHKTPGEFRTSQNWIGGRLPSDARFVPPPVDEMNDALDKLEKFLHRPNPEKIPALIECALVHYQFEAIHPFLDGNGRVGRLLVTLLAIERNCLSHPLLYLSAYFESNREEYYDRLMEVSQTGEWTSWLVFFLNGVGQQAYDAILRAGRVLDIQGRYIALDVTPTARRVVDMLFVNPFVTIKRVAEKVGVTHGPAATAVRQLEEIGILHPFPPIRERGQVYVARELLDAFTSPMKSV